MLFCTFQFLVVLVLAPRYGLLARRLRLRNLTPQELKEDILGTVIRYQGEPATISDMTKRIDRPEGEIRKAIRNMRKEGLLDFDGARVSLTDAGAKEANRILRAHRLWEAYLSHTGAPESELHSRAHELEHVHDPDSVNYIDDLLGHPVTDPHGSTIPQDIEQCSAGSVCKLSVLRKGARAKVKSIDTSLSDNLEIGEEILIGPRKEEGALWTVIRADGTEMTLDHESADNVETLALG
jgi:manganese/iron transport system permease protein/iron/zinc/copper transport system permease protein